MCRSSAANGAAAMGHRHPVGQRLHRVGGAVGEVGEAVAVGQRQREADDLLRRARAVGAVAGRARGAIDLFAGGPDWGAPSPAKWEQSPRLAPAPRRRRKGRRGAAPPAGAAPAGGWSAMPDDSRRRGSRSLRAGLGNAGAVKRPPVTLGVVRGRLLHPIIALTRGADLGSHGPGHRAADLPGRWS